jgi:heptosyltransferase-1
MARAILIVKTSSLGDVIHNMPAVHDLRTRRPDVAIDWAVEEAYAPLVALHPAVRAAVPVAVRRWRRAPFAAATWREIGGLRTRLRTAGYERIVDTQGLVKSALVASLAPGRRVGYDAASAREPLAARFYAERHAVDRALHAVERCRRLVGAAFGYAPDGPVDYGFTIAPDPAIGEPHAVLLHATARAEKAWPESHWIALGRKLADAGLRALLPWGDAAERARSERLAEAIPGAVVPARRPIDAAARMLAAARLVVGVDTGLLHLAVALRVPTVAVFVATDPALTGPVGSGPLAVCGTRGVVPAVDAVLAAAAAVAPAPTVNRA